MHKKGKKENNMRTDNKSLATQEVSCTTTSNANQLNNSFL
jgi:hypothetical protein